MLSANTLERTGGVGLSDTACATNRRRMLDVIDALHRTGVQEDTELPVIAVIGQQSAGKSSLIEAISGIRLPRATGTCTRCPTECRLSRSEESWQCTVSLHIRKDSQGRALGQPKVERFGDVIYDKDEVEDRIRRAQRAILNPNMDYRAFLEGDHTDSASREVTFSSNYISLEIRGEDVEDLSFCDLPGMIASVSSGQDENDIELVKQLIVEYIEKESCIILLTVACETDFQNQGAHRLARTYDPEGTRTIGVLTKPDRMEVGNEDNWIRRIRNQDEPLTHGWFSVKQPDSRAISDGITYEAARVQERKYFSDNAPWNGLDFEHQNRLGTSKLVERLSDVLSDCISMRLPSIQEDLERLLAEVDKRLAKLPKPPSADPLSEVLSLLSDFSKSLGKYLEGTPKADGLLQSIRPSSDAFRDAIRATEPDFRPYERIVASRHPEAHKFVAPSFLSHEGPAYTPADDSRAIFVDDVKKRADQYVLLAVLSSFVVLIHCSAIPHRARTRELPGYVPFVVNQEYIAAITQEWKGPTAKLFHKVHATLVKHVKELIAQQFAQYPLLQSRVTTITTDFLTHSANGTLKRLRWLLELESRPRTLNEGSYFEYASAFWAHYKGWRPTTLSSGDGDPRTTFTGRLDDPSQHDFHKGLKEVMGGLAKMAIHGVKQGDVANLLEGDRYDTALEIMGSVRAYFQVAHKRFTDNVPMVIDYELVLGLDRDQALEKALRKGLGIGREDAVAQCAEFVKEPRHVAERRGELLKKRERLETGRRELLGAFL
ncbi:P-loop containing nucleoside triphosphate hydrolase protein [Ganoderma leucocontextum]|nr:P-loop containing nucleoside triphosphate hydrolase protein [Ganoderma leucocontextum]